MPTRFRWLLPLLLAACSATAAPPLPQTDPADAGMSAPRLERLHAFMREATDDDGYLGGVTLVARGGRLVDWQAYGHRDLARAQPMQRNDIFRIYSMTKTITSVAVLMLMEDGRLGLEDPVTRYLPELAVLQVVDGGTADTPVLRAPATPITLRMLLTHTAGFAAGLPGDEIAGELRERVDTRAATDLRGVVERLAKAPLAADPGTRFGYEGANTDVLARVVEVVSGEPFDRFLQARIFTPLRMTDTGFTVPRSQRERVVDITVMGDDGTLVLDDGVSARAPGEALTPYPSGAGGLYSTAADYARFAQMLLDGGTLDGASILGRKTVELMLRNHLTMLDPPVTQFSASEGFGLGGYVVIDAAARGVPGSPGQFGWTGAASTAYWIDPQERLLAILLLQHLPNGKPDDLPRISRRFQALVPQALLP
ncbi:serine hydrolase domain-containing protein [Chiayiivirga flava]|uniref:CubicO group peptidase (Beta-lactamase class C family) n=1 Tax=Chiayiivirga flava TaxID=659595 RepID=A0A7W8G0H3_9GAMM|nr:serine hydrolase [Chiayiivirga flava]MBB5208299.1 CubicO group peptidase (beta-lactamase class C family) [Chiayiivirga flava]